MWTNAAFCPKCLLVLSLHCRRSTLAPVGTTRRLIDKLHQWVDVHSSISEPSDQSTCNHQWASYELSSDRGCCEVEWQAHCHAKYVSTRQLNEKQGQCLNRAPWQCVQLAPLYYLQCWNSWPHIHCHLLHLNQGWRFHLESSLQYSKVRSTNSSKMLPIIMFQCI